MIRGSLAEFAPTLQGRCTAPARFEGVSIDSRRAVSGALFVAIRGERMDGHKFVTDAARAGVAAAMVERELDTPLPQMIVADTTAGLGQLASHWRQRFTLPVIGVTGSNGKTTVKQMLAAIMACRGEVLATRGNLNNHIGMPLTLLELDERHQAAVIEMGANHAGEIALLAGLARPDVGLVTNAGRAHLEGFGSLDGVARAKGEMFEALPEDGVAVINTDDAYAELWLSLAGSRPVIRFGHGELADVRPGSSVQQTADGGQWFVLVTPQGEAEVRLPLPGAHNISNALAAAAAALAAGCTPVEIASGLACVDGAPGRLQLHQTAGGACLLDDSYNANPDSLAVALDVLAAREGRRILVLGDMGELGPEGRVLHAEMGCQARASGIEHLYTLGELSAAASEAFGEGAAHSTGIEALLARLHDCTGPDCTILVKGSRAMQMERVVSALATPVVADAGGD